MIAQVGAPWTWKPNQSDKQMTKKKQRGFVIFVNKNTSSFCRESDILGRNVNFWRPYSSFENRDQGLEWFWIKESINCITMVYLLIPLSKLWTRGRNIGIKSKINKFNSYAPSIGLSRAYTNSYCSTVLEQATRDVNPSFLHFCWFLVFG